MVNENYSQTEVKEEQTDSTVEQKASDNVLDNDKAENQDIIDEASNDDTLTESPEEELSEEQLEIQRLKQEVDEKQNRILRLQADFDNYRRRVRLDQEAASKYRAQSLIENLLPALDNFDRALNVEATDEATKQVLKGMDMVYRQITEALKTEGLEVIEAVGKEFDPNFHQAVMQVEEPDFDSNIVTEELQKGYQLKDRVLRPTMVKVNQ